MKRRVLSPEAEEQLERWPAQARKRLGEAFEDAASEVQCEFIQRSVAAGHSPAEIQAFADEIRALDDEALFEKCTLRAGRDDFTVEQLLRAEGDPLYAFELNGGELSPAEEAPLPTVAPLKASAFMQPVQMLERSFSRPKPQFEAESQGARAEVKPSGSGASFAAAIRQPISPFQDAVNELSRSLGVTWREFELDVDGGQSTEDAVRKGSAALQLGLPVAVWVGSRPGDHRRAIVALQLNVSGSNRAWQLYDPLSGEVVWANEADLLNRNELPFVDKANRRLTRVALPSSRMTAW